MPGGAGGLTTNATAATTATTASATIPLAITTDLPPRRGCTPLSTGRVTGPSCPSDTPNGFVASEDTAACDSSVATTGASARSLLLGAGEGFFEGGRLRGIADRFEIVDGGAAEQIREQIVAGAA